MHKACSVYKSESKGPGTLAERDEAMQVLLLRMQQGQPEHSAGMSRCSVQEVYTIQPILT